ncbi:MAG: MlaD family protein [Verrucomicrobiota bacterium]|jgi:phospholipid/cholesterol/gamma-HCH transport system substrate-binding protein
MDEMTNIPEPSRRDDRDQRLEPRFKFRRVNEITGTFVLVVVALLIAAVVWTGHSQRWFKSRVTLRIVLPEAGAAGIRQGSEVYFLGTLVGSVSDVIVDTTGRMEAQASIRRDFFRFVRADSSAVIKKKFGVAGDSFFEITRGLGQPLPEKNASIVCNEQFQSALEAAVEEIRRETVLVLKKTSTGLDAWTMLGTNLITTQERLDQLVGRVDDITADVQAGKGTVGKLLTDPATADELKTLLVKANHSVDELQVTLNNLQQASTNLPAISDAAGKEAKDLPGLVLQTQVSMREVERLVEAMQRTWLLRKYVNSTNPPPLRPLPGNQEPEKKPVKVFRSPRDSAN